uniref:Skp1_POZ domain-containing protein n=2 Tax=Rhabditophanes sp. KR3021 TaxID=114890 RepID=A0AC35U7C5_9BILA
MATYTVLVICKDNIKFDLELNIAVQIGILRKTVRGLDSETPPMPLQTIHLPNVRGVIFSKIIEWCEAHLKGPQLHHPEYEIRARAKYIEHFTAVMIQEIRPVLLETIIAANDLGMQYLLFTLCSGIAKAIEGKSEQEVYSMFLPDDDFFSCKFRFVGL